MCKINCLKNFFIKCEEGPPAEQSVTTFWVISVILRDQFHVLLTQKLLDQGPMFTRRILGLMSTKLLRPAAAGSEAGADS
jgi:hypothetical protein